MHVLARMSTPPPSNASSGTPLGTLELRCPPLPKTLIDAMELINDPEQLEVHPVTEMVERDPLVVARLLQIVNSAYYGIRRSVSSVERAVVLLGPVSVAGIVVGMNMLKLRSVLEGPAAACFSQLIEHSMATAKLARDLIDTLDAPGLRRQLKPRLDVIYSAALLHDFGKIILVYNYPDEAVALYEKRTLDGHVTDSDVRYVEQLTFGCDHTEAGEYAANKLNFPELLTHVIRHHHDPSEAPPYDPLLAPILQVIDVANHASRALGFGFAAEGSWAHCAEAPSWEGFAAQSTVTSPDALQALLEPDAEALDQYVKQMTRFDVDDLKGPRRMRRLRR